MKIPWKKGIGTDLKRRNRERQEHQKYIFNQKYNKPKVYQFPKAIDIDMNRFFCFPKFGKEFYMPKACIAIYPVLCLLSDFENDKGILPLHET